MVNSTPCRDCDRRGCGAYHDECPAYQEFLKWNEKRREEKNKRAEVGALLSRDVRYRKHCCAKNKRRNSGVKYYRDKGYSLGL